MPTFEDWHEVGEVMKSKDQRIAELQAALSEQEATAASYKQQLEALTKEVAGLKGRFEKDQERIKTQAEYLTAAQAEIERLSQENTRLKVDAEKWREYQERKRQLIEGGLLKSPLRDDAAIAATTSCKDLNEVKKGDLK